MALPLLPNQPQSPIQVSDDQLIQLAQSLLPKIPLQQILAIIQKFKAKGMSNEQIVTAAKYIEDQSQMGGKMMPNLKSRLMGQ